MYVPSPGRKIPLPAMYIPWFAWFPGAIQGVNDSCFVVFSFSGFMYRVPYFVCIVSSLVFHLQDCILNLPSVGGTSPFFRLSMLFAMGDPAFSEHCIASTSIYIQGFSALPPPS